MKHITLTHEEFRKEYLGRRVVTTDNKLGVIIGYSKTNSEGVDLIIMGVQAKGWTNTMLRPNDNVLLENPYQYYYYILPETIEAKIEVKDIERNYIHLLKDIIGGDNE